MPHPLLAACRRTAAAWQNPDHPARVAAVGAALEAAPSLTPEVLLFALNQWMHALQEADLSAWLAPEPADARRVAVVRSDVLPPMQGWEEMLAVLLRGDVYVGAVPEAIRALQAAFLDELAREYPLLQHVFSPANEAVDAAFMGEGETAPGLAPKAQWVQPAAFSIAVLDGHEASGDLEALAEDALLYEGYGRRSVRLLWAPASLTPDAVLETFGLFRSVFPAGAGTAARLKMQQAWLEATNTPHGYGDDLGFLLSKGEPEPQPPGHWRWVSYEHPEDVATWYLRSQAHVAACFVRNPDVWGEWPTEPFGQAHRQPLGRAASVAWLGTR